MIAISVNNLAKRYFISAFHKSSVRLSFRTEILKFFWPNADKKEFWALRNINFKVESGESMGIIGVNGSGKSTLLKILSNITDPSQGEVRIVGNVSSLLGIGLGFQGDLTGRDNIYLSGIIMGLTKKDLDKEFEEIVAFSEIKKFIDTPVKFYSSGMFLRLAFAVATAKCMAPDVFIIDEVFAVGDAKFQEKSLKRMSELIKNNGTTVVFASHNLKAIEDFCDKCIWLDKGKIREMGPAKSVVKEYIKFKQSSF